MLSVIIPVHNGQRYLLQACQSVFEQKIPLALHIVNDGSTDETPAILQRLEAPPWVKLFSKSQPRGGPSAARNRAIEVCSTDYLVFLDSDDVLTPGSLERQLEAARQSLEEIPWGKTQWTDMELKPLEHPQYRNWLVQLGAVLWPRSLFERVGLLDESLEMSEDVDFFMRCRQAGVVFQQRDDVVQFYRRHPDNLTSDLARSQKSAVTAIHRLLQRRRGQGQ